MSGGLTQPRFLLDERGEARALDEFVVGAAWCDGVPGFALGDGRVVLGGWRDVAVHGGAILSLAAGPGGFITGGDDGAFCRVGTDGAVQTVAGFGKRWVEQVAARGDLVACGVGKAVHLWQGGRKLKELAHPSTVTGIAFDAKGKRVAASHYNGATLWFVGAKVDSPRLLEWKGSHIGVALHPAGEAAVTAMQENALHGWRLPDGQHMRMSGYPAKTESFGFTHSGKWLASGGADTVVLWPFFGGGPMGKPPMELAGGDGVLCTRVAVHPQQDMVAAGFADGLVVLADIASERILGLVPPGKGSVSALAWKPDGTVLAAGTENGFAALIDLGKR